MPSSPDDDKAKYLFKFDCFKVITWRVGVRNVIAPTSSAVLFLIRIYFIRISRLKFTKFYEYFNNKAEAEILKRIDIILC